MEYLYPLTILTPTYNRGQYLSVLYDSLCNQMIKNFQWLIIDDGSTDNTESVVESFVDCGFAIDYKKKPNGGKHTALNYSHAFIKGKLVCIVDSDDWLLPNAVSDILDNQNLYLNNDRVKCFSYLRGKTKELPINTSFPNTQVVSNHIDFRINGKRTGDCCEVVYTDVFKEFPFPEHKNEKFLGEGYLWNNIGFNYDTVYIPHIIYICEYLDGGLTKSGRALRIKSPLGGMDNCNSFFCNLNNRKVTKSVLLKEAMLFVCYGKFAGFNKKEIVERTINKPLISRTYFLGYLLFLVWRIKYREFLL